MEEGVNVVLQLAIILTAAGVFTVISRALKQPLILGYIVAGFIVGPHLGLFPQFDEATVKQWSDLGIVFLLFALGLEFSFKKLLKIGGSALITAGVQCVGMFIVGMITGSALGWTSMESVFLGGMMSMSSTTIIIKSFNDMGLKNKPYASLIFGALVFLDLIAVLMMVLLSTLAVSQKFDGVQMAWSLAKLLFFIILWFLVGIYVIPTLLKKAQKYLNDEILLITSIGMCFGMVAFANAVGFSSALGAFVMGSILAETTSGERIGSLMGSIKDLFGAIFFVSVGMMVDPAVIAAHWLTILIISVMALVGIVIFASSGALLAGKNLETAVHTGFSMAQLGEFSFIIASLGVSLGVMRDFLYPVIIAVSVITTFTTPYMIKAGTPVYEFLARKLPASIIKKIDHGEQEVKSSAAEENEWRTLIKKYLLRIVMYGVILVAILIVSKKCLFDIATTLLPSASETVKDWLCAIVTLLVMSPFIYGFAVNSGGMKESETKLLKNNPANRWPIIGLILLRLYLASAFVLTAVDSYLNLSWWWSVIVIAAAFVYFIFARGSMKDFARFEDRFFANLNSKSEVDRRNAPVKSMVAEHLAGYDVHIRALTISGDFVYAGETLRNMPFRRDTGINIVKIVRGSKVILTPLGDEKIFPGDRLVAVGTTEQLEAFEKNVGENTVASVEPEEDFAIEKIVLGPDSNLAGRTLRESRVRNSGCTVISVMHNGILVANPSADYRMEEGDTVWIAGEKKSVDWYR